MIVQERANGSVEVAAIDPITSMQAVKNQALEKIAAEIQEKLHRVIDAL